MKKFLNIFFVTLGVVFFLLLIAGTLFIVIDPYGIRPLLSETTKLDDNTATDKRPASTTDSNPLLNEAQEKALKSIGVDPAKIPTQITTEQEACFEEKLGQQRVSEIKGGDAPTITDYLKAKSCL